MSDLTRQKVYEEAKKFVADAERPLEGLIEAIKEHRTAERDEAGPTLAKSEPSQGEPAESTQDGGDSQPPDPTQPATA